MVPKEGNVSTREPARDLLSFDLNASVFFGVQHGKQKLSFCMNDTHEPLGGLRTENTEGGLRGSNVFSQMLFHMGTH